ncbi:MAG: hypothetical protein NHG13_00670 [Candidatus Shikimatogenerans bostrichidophilus]|nr:MAG: hypothetical protein NHG13_00670 [Candidatus Shikimatogenerans bostrichidophilus]
MGIKLMYTFKQKKYSHLINKFLNKLFIIENKYKFKNIFITVIYVYINKILTNANIYITIYPDIYKNQIYFILNKKKKYFKNKLSIFFKNKFKIPNLNFFLSNKKILNLVNLNKLYN